SPWRVRSGPTADQGHGGLRVGTGRSDGDACPVSRGLPRLGFLFFVVWLPGARPGLGWSAGRSGDGRTGRPAARSAPSRDGEQPTPLGGHVAPDRAGETVQVFEADREYGGRCPRRRPDRIVAAELMVSEDGDCCGVTEGRCSSCGESSR